MYEQTTKPGDNFKPEISIILPCRNEEKALPFCLEKIKKVIHDNKYFAEVIVSDSSSDNSKNIARAHNVTLIAHNKNGYGAAYIEGFKNAKGKYIIMADADDTYDFSEIPKFLTPLKQDKDFIIGNRFGGIIEPGAMPWANRHIGNPILSFVLSLILGKQIIDTQSGMRAIKRSSLEKLNLQTTGMEFASEMIIKAILNDLKIEEVPINYYKRKGTSKLKPFSDAWKHLRFMLLFSPLTLFLAPGIILFLTGVSSMIWLYFFSPTIFGIKIFYHPLFLSSLLSIIGYQLIIFAGFAKSYTMNHLGEKNALFEKLFSLITIEKASSLGITLSALGFVIFLLIFFNWIKAGHPALNEIKNSLVALTFIVIGIQTIFSSFMLSILGIKK